MIMVSEAAPHSSASSCMTNGTRTTPFSTGLGIRDSLLMGNLPYHVVFMLSVGCRIKKLKKAAKTMPSLNQQLDGLQTLGRHCSGIYSIRKIGIDRDLYCHISDVETSRNADIGICIL